MYVLEKVGRNVVCICVSVFVYEEAGLSIMSRGEVLLHHKTRRNTRIPAWVEYWGCDGLC